MNQSIDSLQKKENGIAHVKPEGTRGMILVSPVLVGMPRGSEICLLERTHQRLVVPEAFQGIDSQQGRLSGHTSFVWIPKQLQTNNAENGI